MADQELTPEEQAAVASAGSGGGGSLNLNKPKPGTTRSTLHGQYIVQEKANAQGEWEVDQSFTPVPFVPSTAPSGGAPHTINLPNDAGIIQWDDTAKQWQMIGGSAAPPKPTYTTIGHSMYEIVPGQAPRLVGTDTAAIAREQEAQDLARDQYTRGVGQDQITNQRNATQDQFNNRLNQNADVRAATTLLSQLEAQRASNAIAQGQLEETQQGNQFNRNYRAFVEMPMAQVQDERAAQTARLAAAAQAGTYGVQRANEGRQAGQDAVSTMLSTLPYRVNPQWNQQFTARVNAETAGQPLPGYSADALGFRAPDLEGARQAASASAQAQLPTYDQLVSGAPQFAGMDPQEMARIQRMLLGLPYQAVA